ELRLVGSSVRADFYISEHCLARLGSAASSWCRVGSTRPFRAKGEAGAEKGVVCWRVGRVGGGGGGGGRCGRHGRGGGGDGGAGGGGVSGAGVEWGGGGAVGVFVVGAE